MRRVVIFATVAVVCVLLAFWSPWLNWKLDVSELFGVEKPEEISGLRVYSIRGEIEVFVDGKSVGKVTPDKSPLNVENVEPGDHFVSIKRVSSVRNAYWDYNKSINFIADTDVVVSYYLGSQDIFSEGHIIYATEKAKEDDVTMLNITTNILESRVEVDSRSIPEGKDNKFTQVLDLNMQHNISVTKPGYETIEFTILPEDQESRNKLKKYNLNLEIQLMQQPLEVE